MTHEVQRGVQGIYESSLIEKAEINLVATLNAKLTVDGDQYCWLYGENLHDGVSGFGKSPYLAALDFNKNFYKELP